MSASLRRTVNRRMTMDSKLGVYPPEQSNHVLKHHKEMDVLVRNRVINQGRIRAILSAIVLGVFLIFSRHLPAPAKRLPESYVLCSQEGKVYTVDPLYNTTDCILIHGKIILSVGSLEHVRQSWETETGKKYIPIRYTKSGSIVIPGLSDSHGHILEYGKNLQLDLDGLPTRQEVVKRIRAYIEARPNILNDTNAWIEGGGWDHTSWPGGTWPTAADLENDPIVRGRPIVLLGKDGHAFWCSEKAIALSGPFPDTIEGGVIVRDDKGLPAGIFLDKAMDLIQLPFWSETQMLEYFTAAAKDALSHGLTSITDAGLNPFVIKFLEQLITHTELPIRIYAMRFFNESDAYWGDVVPKIIGAADNRFTVRSVKFFADGALRSGGAALYEPYTDNPSTRGFFRTDPSILKRVIPLFINDGWQVNTHCIGDRANGMFLDLMEEVMQNINVRSQRPRIEHSQIIAPDDFSRMGKVGVISSIQPSHVIDDMTFAEDRLGPERVKGTYAFRTLINQGVPITLGTDFPVASINPLNTFYAAITRLSFTGESPHGRDGWFPEQRLTREEALKGMTLDAAYASFTESILGSITPGKRADYVVLSQDIMTIPFSEILKTEVLATVLDGKTAYGKV